MLDIRIHCRARRRGPRPVWLAVLSILLLAASAEARTVVKMATLAPEGSVWDKIFKEMGAEWQEATGGEVSLRVYAGGVAGNEPDVVRKMRIGQLHAAVLTVSGLTVIDPGFEVFSIPMFFESYDELIHVQQKMRPIFEKRLADKGYVMLNWGLGGWIHFFSKQPIRVVDDLRAQKLFVGGSDDATIQLWRSNGFQPVALQMTDMLTGLQTGMIEAMPSTPLAALSFQWFRLTPYMQDLGLAPLIGATVITKKTWDQLSPETRHKVLAAAADAEKRLLAEVPDQDRRAVEQMKERGVSVVEVPAGKMAEWNREAERFISFQRDKMEAKDLLDVARRERDAFRASHAATASASR
jgi:TRAP-type transport system periplasmic protein